MTARHTLPIGMMFVLIVSACGIPSELTNQEQSCLQSYEEGAYEDAARCYRTLLDHHGAPASIYYNLGNAEFRAGNLGLAIAAWRATSLLNPRDPDVDANMAIASALVADDLPAFSNSAARKWILFWADAMGLGELLWSSLLCWALLCFVVGLYVAFGIPTRSVIMGVAGVAVLVGGATTWRYLEVRTTTPAIIVVQETEALSGRDRDATVLFVLHEGTETRVREKTENWARIELSNGMQGWVKKEVLQIVEVW